MKFIKGKEYKIVSKGNPSTWWIAKFSHLDGDDFVGWYAYHNERDIIFHEVLPSGRLSIKDYDVLYAITEKHLNCKCSKTDLTKVLIYDS